jgi:hypothetical protein
LAWLGHGAVSSGHWPRTLDVGHYLP